MMRHTFTMLMMAMFAVSLFAACGSEDVPAVRSLSITSNDIVDGTLYVIKGTGVFVGVVAIDESGEPVGEEGLEQVEWTTDTPLVLQVYSLGATGVIEGQLDWFDTTMLDSGMTEDAGDISLTGAYEPEAIVTASLGDATATIRVRVILNAAGSWYVTLDDGTAITLELEQNGRNVTHSATGANGTINGASFSLDFAGYVLDGSFVDPDTVRGTYVKPGGGTGTWEALRNE